MLQGVEFGYKSIGIAVGQRQFTLDDVLELLEHVFASRISHIGSVGHKVIQAAITFVDIFSGGSFDKHYHLQEVFQT